MTRNQARDQTKEQTKDQSKLGRWAAGGLVLAALGCSFTAKTQPSGSSLDAGPGSLADAEIAARDGLGVDGLIMADVFPFGGGADATCAMQSAVAEKLPLDLFVMMDSSGSMTELTATGVSKWDAVRSAMTAFFSDPQSTGIGVALQYFPQIRASVPADCLTDPECGTFGPCTRIRTCVGAASLSPCNVDADCARGQTCALLGTCAVSLDLCAPAGQLCGPGEACEAFAGFCPGRDICDIPPYATPAVAVAPLPGAAAGLIASLAGHEPDGATPTAPALSGAIQAAEARARANPGRKVAVVLVTDGFPSECTPLDIPGIAALAAAAAAGTPAAAGGAATPAIPTFVIGVFAAPDMTAATTNLDALATGGGTAPAVVISTGQDVAAALGTALNQIRSSATACEYKIPAPTTGAIDFGKVNVELTGSSGAITMVGHVPARAGCDPTRGGWYYDVDPSTGGKPSSIVTCDATCAAFRADTGARVSIVLGCQTYVVL